MSKNTPKNFIWIAIFVLLALRGVTLNRPVPTYAEYYVNLAQMDSSGKYSPTAIENFKKAHYHNPHHPLANLRLGSFHMNNGNKPDALKHYQYVVNTGIREMQYAKAYNAIAIEYFNEQNYPKAAELFTISSTLRRVENDHYYLGLMALFNNNIDLAQRHLSVMHDALVGSTAERIRTQPYYDKLEGLITKKTQNPHYIIKDYAVKTSP